MLHVAWSWYVANQTHAIIDDAGRAVAAVMTAESLAQAAAENPQSVYRRQQGFGWMHAFDEGGAHASPPAEVEDPPVVDCVR